MKRVNFAMLVGFAMVVIGSSDAHAFEGPDRLAFRMGMSTSGTGNQFQQYELSGSWDFPWEHRLGGDWVATPGLELNIGSLHRGDNAAVVGGFGPYLQFRHGESRWAVDLGVRATGVGKDEFSDRQFGGWFQFTSYIGLNVRLSDTFSFEYRAQHMSNARTYTDNDGMDLQTIGFVLHY
jgi:hypothetical protein